MSPALAFLLNAPLWGTKKKFLFKMLWVRAGGCHGGTATPWLVWMSPVCLDVHCAPLNGLIISNYSHSSWSVRSPGQDMGFSLGMVLGDPRACVPKIPPKRPSRMCPQSLCPQGRGPKVPKAGDPQGQVSGAHVPKAGGLKGPGPSGTNPQSSCPQFWGPKGPRARSLQSLSPERPSPQLPSLSAQNPIPEQRSQIPAQDTPRSHGKRGQKGAVTSEPPHRAVGTLLGTQCASPTSEGGFPHSFGAHGVTGLEAPGIGAMVAPQLDVPPQGSELCPEPFPRTQTTQRSLGAVPRHYSHAGTGKL